MFERIKKQPPISMVLSILFLIFGVYSNVYQFDFVYYDDHLYVIDNIHLRSGFSKENLIWALTADEAGFWHPMTWLSLILDYSWYGLNPGGYHGTSLLLHMANTLLLFSVLSQMTFTKWRSALVAALFALHPFHVEPVAWIASRKDVLSAFFFILTLSAYLSYVKHPGMPRYFLVFLFFLLGLMSKPMLVTLPFVLILLDFWPLKRMTPSPSSIARLFFEKLPLIVLAFAVSIVTFHAESKIGALKSFALYPLDMRVANALMSYVTYIGKTIWPTHLAVYYPYPSYYSFWQTLLCASILSVMTWLAVKNRRRYPYFIVGWLWFLGSLVPVLGLIQIGSHAMADRYTYLPLIGLFIVFAWAANDIVEKGCCHKIIMCLAMTLILSFLAFASWMQVRHWQNATTLFRHAVAVTENSFIGHNNLGAALARQGQWNEAIYHYQEALRIKPDYEEAYFNLGSALMNEKRYREAIPWFELALKNNPHFVEAYNNEGISYAHAGNITDAIKCFETALRIKPDYVDARRNRDIAHRQSNYN